MKPTSIVILGSGYTGRFLVPTAAQRYPFVFATSRDPERRLGHLSPDRRLQFDLTQPGTWTNIPEGAELIWCFPATPIEQVQAFSKTLGALPRRLVVLSSTSAYDVGSSQDYPPPWIDETAPIDLSKPRVQGEEWLRKECGAIVLRVSGIYGPGRNPLDWIRQGRIGPSRKYVNLIHVEDLAAICLAALDRGKPGEVYNVSDGAPHTWDEIYMTSRDRWNLPPVQEASTHDVGKRIDTQKLRSSLGELICHPDLFAALEELEQWRTTSAGAP